MHPLRSRPLHSFFLVLFAISCQLPSPCLAFWNLKSAAERELVAIEEEDSSSHTEDVPVEYGVDVSFPIQHEFVSTNYAWLPHNLDSSLPVPSEYKDMPVQPLGDRQAFYKDFIDGCVQNFGKKGNRCIQTESERVEMALRQPQSMQVRCRTLKACEYY